MEALLPALARAALLLGGTVLLYAPLAWLERWAALPPSERERLGQAPLLPVTHALKLLSKRSRRPAEGDALVHVTAPVLLLLPSLFVLAQIPPGPPLMTTSGPVSTAVTAGYGAITWAMALWLITPGGILLSGWSGGDRLALLGALRLMAVRLSAMVVVFLGLAGAARVAGTPELDLIIASQAGVLGGALPAIGLFTNPLGFGATVVALAVLSQRGQRTRPDRNADLVESYAITARGPTLLAHRLFEIVDVLVAASLVAAVFLGGWLIFGLDDGQGGSLGFVASRVAVWWIKVLLVAAGLLLVRRALPPLRHDQALRLVWTVLVPLAAAGLVIAPLLRPWVQPATGG